MPRNSWLSRLLGRSRKSEAVKRPRWRPAPLALEWLEDRLAPAVTAVLDANNDAVITGTAGADTVTMSIENQGLANQTLRITDAGGVTAGAGFTQDGANSATILTSAITGLDIFITTDDGADTINVRATPAGILTHVDEGIGVGDVVNVGSDAPGNAGTLDNLDGVLQLDPTLAPGTRTLNINAGGSMAADTVTVAAGASPTFFGTAGGGWRIDEFNFGSNVVNLNLGSGGDVVNVVSEIAGERVNISTGGGDDRVTFTNAARLQGGSITGGSGDLEICVETGDYVINAPVSTDGTLRLTAEAGNITQTAAGLITAANLGATASAGINLNQANAVTGVFAANAAAGGVTFNSTAGFSVGSITAGACFPATTGVTGTGNSVSLRTAGALAINAAVTAQQTVTLNAGGAVTQTAGITASNLELLGTGPFTLESTSNNITTLAANTTEAISFRDADGIVVGLAGGTLGITTTDDDVTLATVTNNLTISGDINAGTGTVRLQSLGGPVTGASAIKAQALGVRSLGLGANIFLTSNANDVAILAAETTGQFAFIDANGFTLGTVTASGPFTPGITGLTTGGDVEICVDTGDLNINAPINAAGFTVLLDATAGNVTQSGAGIITAANLGASAGAAITLNLANVVTGTFAAVAGGAITFNDTTGFTVGAVGAGVCFPGATGVTTTDGNISLFAGGTLTATSVAAGGTNRTVALFTGGGDLLVGTVSATGNVGFTVNGAIIDNNGAANNVTAPGVVLQALFGIGSGDALETMVSNLAAQHLTSGNVEIANTGNLSITKVTGPIVTVSGVNNNGGNVVISTTGDLTVDQPVTASGTVQLTGGAADLGSTITLNAAVTGTAVTISGGGGADTFALNVVGASPTTLLGQAGNDNFVFADGVSVNGTIDGGADTDKLDYSAYTTNVQVNLGQNGQFRADLEGAQENPPNASTATGQATLTYDAVTRTMDIALTVVGISADPVVEPNLRFHIHQAPIGVNGPIIIDLFNRAGGVDAPGNIGTITPTADGFTYAATGVALPAVNEGSFFAGNTYFNIHTTAAPGGLIRGQIAQQTPSAAASGTATGTAGVLNIEDATGGAGNDSLIGRPGANTLNGLGGNDILVGGQGGDTLLGGADNDLLVWSNGDGSDIMDGEGGIDTVQVNGNTLVGDVFETAANGARVAFRRVTPGPFTLDIGTTETINQIGHGGNDSFTIFDLTGVDDLTAINLFGVLGNDTFDLVADLPPGLPASLQGGSGDDTFNVKKGVITVAGSTGANRLTVDSSADPSNQVITFSNNRILGGANFDITYNALGGNYSRGVELTTGIGSDQVTVRSTAGPTTLRTGAGNDVVTIAVTAGPLSVALIGAVNVEAGTGNNFVIVSEAASLVADVVVVGPASVQGLSGAGFLINYVATGGTFGQVSYTGGLAGDTIVYVGKLPGQMVLNGGGGNDVFGIRVTEAFPVDGLLVDGGAGFNIMTVLDVSGGGIIRNSPTGPSSGIIVVSYFGKPISLFPYLNIQQVLGIDASANYIQALFRNLLGRAAPPAAVAFWTGFLNQFGRVATALAIAQSPEGQAFLVREWYLQFVGRLPTAAESAPLVQALLAGHSQESVLGTILGSAQAPWLAGVRSALVNHYFVKFLRREGGAGVAGWVNSAQTIGGIRLLFLVSEEFFTNGL